MEVKQGLYRQESEEHLWKVILLWVWRGSRGHSASIRQVVTASLLHSRVHTMFGAVSGAEDR